MFRFQILLHDFIFTYFITRISQFFQIYFYIIQLLLNVQIFHFVKINGQTNKTFKKKYIIFI